MVQIFEHNIFVEFELHELFQPVEEDMCLLMSFQIYMLKEMKMDGCLVKEHC